MLETALSEGSLIGGRYRLEHHLGEGGMGTVWSALHTVTHRAVAMKFLKDTMRGRADLRQRFLREASAASALKHPNAVEILDVFDFEESSPVMVMELLRGETLGSKLARDQRLSMEETAAILLPVVSAVGTAHALGIVHRDLKPDNLFLEERAEGTKVKVLDFGIAKLTAEYYLSRDLSALHTDAGSMLGTPYYMAPEQASGDAAVDHRADVWSLGVILYECLSGMRPIEGENMPQVISRLMSAGIIPLERLAPELPHEVAGIVMQMLSRDASRRPDGLLEVSKVLARHARATAPDFAEPLRDRSSFLPHPPVVSQRPKARVVASGDADPQGPTMISAPPVNQSVNIARQPKAQRKALVYVLAGVALAACMLWFLLTQSSNRAEAERAATSPSTGATPLAMQPLVVANAPSAPAVEATPSAAPALAAKARPPSAAATIKPRPGMKPDPVPKRSADEDTLFSGRK
ncbi:MAG TPA: serine/threonine-protein kinase [Polyangiaceae bacterium]|jgi:serine/threonine protein kinase|nr:serine/threonine-protein kinase [Polyangiaceae bacterium]